MKSINTQNNRTNNSIFELKSNSNHTSWNNRRRYSNATQLRFI